MNAVGIDVSKGKSTVTIHRPGDVVIMPPCDIQHTQSAINSLIELIRGLDGETKVCMEHTGRYYEPVATKTSGMIPCALPRPTRLIPKKSPVTHLTDGQN